MIHLSSVLLLFSVSHTGPPQSSACLLLCSISSHPLCDSLHLLCYQFHLLSLFSSVVSLLLFLISCVGCPSLFVCFFLAPGQYMQMTEGRDLMECVFRCDLEQGLSLQSALDSVLV